MGHQLFFTELIDIILEGFLEFMIAGYFEL
jgi:hypothetical protein